MNNNEDKELVKYNDQWWMLESVSKSGMATIWRDGQPALVPKEQIEYSKND